MSVLKRPFLQSVQLYFSIWEECFASQMMQNWTLFIAHSNQPPFYPSVSPFFVLAEI